MIKFICGNILKSETEAIVNTVNTQGVMGKGIALSFKEAYPLNFKIYKKACNEGTIDIGKLLVTETGQLYPKYIINFPTKKHWRNPSKYEYIEEGLKDLVRLIKEYSIKSISIPPLGAGNGRLEWERVKNILINHLSNISSDIDIVIFEPGYNDQKPQIKKDINLTAQRAIFIYVLWHYQILGYQINLLVAQKIAYFLQKFGENLNLDFEKGLYGPYSQRLNHLLKYLNGGFIIYDESVNSPSTTINILNEKYNEVEKYYNERLSDEQKTRAQKVLNFIEGFESTYGLELLATISFIVEKTGKRSFEEILALVAVWTERKKEIMKPNHIKIALTRLQEFNIG